MNKDRILEGIANRLNALRVAAEITDVEIRPQKSVLDLPSTGTIIIAQADELEHQCGHFHRLEPLRLKIQTQGLEGRDSDSHKAALDLCRSMFPDAESDDHPDAFEALGDAILASDPDAELSFWYVQGQREEPIEADAWWEDHLVVRVGVKEI